MIYIAIAKDGSAHIEAEDRSYWCGDQDEWVHPNSSHWVFSGDRCREKRFRRYSDAISFALDRGWIVNPEKEAP